VPSLRVAVPHVSFDGGRWSGVWWIGGGRVTWRLQCLGVGEGCILRLFGLFVVLFQSQLNSLLLFLSIDIDRNHFSFGCVRYVLRRNCSSN